MPLTVWKEKLNRSIPIPLYYQLKQCIREDIETGYYHIGDVLPTETELCSELVLSRPTIRQSLMELTKEGYLERVKGKGTYVSRPKLEANFIQKLESFHAQMLALGVQPMTKVIRLEIVPAIPAVNAALNIPDSEELVLLIRLCFGDNSPIALMESYLPAKRFAGIVHEDLTNYSLYIIFAKSFHTTVTRVTRQIEAINASQREAEYLGIQKGKAICLVHNTAYDQDNIIAEYNIAYYRGERSKFTMELKQ